MTKKRWWMARWANWGLGLGFGLTGLALAQTPVMTQFVAPPPSAAKVASPQVAPPADSPQTGEAGPSVGLAQVSVWQAETPKAPDKLVPLPPPPPLPLPKAPTPRVTSTPAAPSDGLGRPRQGEAQVAFWSPPTPTRETPSAPTQTPLLSMSSGVIVPVSYMPEVTSGSVQAQSVRINPSTSFVTTPKIILSRPAVTPSAAAKLPVPPGKQPSPQLRALVVNACGSQARNVTFRYLPDGKLEISMDVTSETLAPVVIDRVNSIPQVAVFKPWVKVHVVR